MLDNDPIQMDPSIETYVREGKKPYKNIKYKSGYIPQENDGEVPILIPRTPQDKAPPRRSQRTKKKTTIWAPSREAKALTACSNGAVLLPSSIQAISEASQ